MMISDKTYERAVTGLVKNYCKKMFEQSQVIPNTKEDENDDVETGIVENDSYAAHPQDIIDNALAERSSFRENQSTISRLAEYLTGFDIENPELIDRLRYDHELIRLKYELPPRGMLSDSLEEYEKIIRGRAKKMEVKIKESSECGRFFKDHSYAGGVFLGNENTIGVDMDKQSKDDYERSLGTLEHEFVHANQRAMSPSMPIEVREYEAYIAGFNMNCLADEDAAEVRENLKMMFQFIAGSVHHWYTSESKKQGAKVEPVWDNAKYFSRKSD